MKRIFILFFVLSIVLFSTITKAQITFLNSAVNASTTQDFCSASQETISIYISEKKTGPTWNNQFLATGNKITLTLELGFTFENSTTDQISIITNGNNTNPTDVSNIQVTYDDATFKEIVITFNNTESEIIDNILLGNIKINTPDDYNVDDADFLIKNECLTNESDKTIYLTSTAPELNISGTYYYNESGMLVSFGGSSSCSFLTLQKWNSGTSKWENLVTGFTYAGSTATLNLNDQVRLLTGAGRYSSTVTFGLGEIKKPVFTAPLGSLNKPCWSDVIALTTTYNFGTETKPDEYRVYLDADDPADDAIITIDNDDLEATLNYTPIANGTLTFSAYFTGGPEIFSAPLTISGLITMSGGESYSLISGSVVPYAEGEIDLMTYFDGTAPTLPTETNMDIDFGNGAGELEYTVFGNATGFYKFILPYDIDPGSNTKTFDTKADNVFYNYNIPNSVKFYYGVEVDNKVCYKEEQTNIIVIRDRIFVPAQSFCSTDTEPHTIIIDKDLSDFTGYMLPPYTQEISFNDFEFSISGTDITNYTTVDNIDNVEITFTPSTIFLDGADQVLIDAKANLIINSFITTGGTGTVLQSWAALTDYYEGEHVQYNGYEYKANQDIPVDIGIIPIDEYLEETKTLPDDQVKLYPREIYPVPSSSSIYWDYIGVYHPPSGSSKDTIGTSTLEYANTSFYIFKTKEDGSLNIKSEYCKSENEIEILEPHGYTINRITEQADPTVDAIVKDADNKWKFTPEDLVAVDDVFEPISWDLYYTDNRGCVAPAVPITFNIDETVDFVPRAANLGLNSDYCPENRDISLIKSADIKSFTNTKVYDENDVFLGNLSNSFNPSEYWNSEPEKTLEIRFDYRHYNGCAYKDTFNVTINPQPTIDYTVDNVCFGDSVRFIGTTTYPDILENLTWEWDFDDYATLTHDGIYTNTDPVLAGTHNGNTTGTYVKPVHNYLDAGKYNVNLKVTSVSNGCETDSTFAITVGSYPQVNFDPKGFVETNITSFDNFSKAEGFDPIDTLIWNFGDPTSPNDIIGQNSIQTTDHLFETTGVHDVVLTISTETGCETSDTVKVPIFPKEIVTTDNIYVAKFDDLNQGWLSSDEFDKGLPSGWKLNPVTAPFNISNTEGRIWQTGDPEDNIYNEKSWVESPCFDISGLDFPLLSMDIYQSVEAGRDGAALQYTLDDGETWKLLGDVNEGVNWYDTRGIVSNPGTQTGASTGWSLSANEWKTARYTLDDLKQEIADLAADYVRFRVAYSSDAGNAPGIETQGFAFDNFNLSSRNRVVMMEQFVNSAHDKILQENEEAWLDAFLVGKNAEVVDMRYHNYISHDYDPLFDLNRPDISARSMEYGATMAQLTMVDGIYRCLANSEVEAKSYYKERTLTDIGFDIDVTHTVNGDNLEISADITKLKEDLLTPGSDKCVVRMAIVQLSIEHDGESYKNVVVELLPNGEGNVVATIPADFPANETMTVTGTWTPSETNITTKGNEFRLVVYVQGIWGVDEIHQVWFEDSIAVPDNTAKTALETEKSGSSNSFTIYPSPVKEKLNINWYETLENPVRWKLVSMSGTVVKEGTTAAGEIHQEIETYQLNKGIYLLLTEDLSSLEVDQRKILIVK